MQIKELQKKTELNFAKKIRATTSPRERPIRPRPSRWLNKQYQKINNNLETLRQNWYGARIVILGLGREGIDTFLFLRKMFPDKIIGVADRLTIANFKLQISKIVRRDKKIRFHLGDSYLKSLKNYDVVIKSPGIAPRIIKPFLRKGQTVTSQTEIFFENCPGKIVGITGTKGKSTTASLIYAILKAGGVKTHLVGNIGKPVLSLLFSASAKDVYVYELSSHQLFNIKKSPQVAVFLNVFPEHLDYYRDFGEYARSKANITRFQKKEDFLVFNAGDKIVKSFAANSKAKKIPINPEGNQLKALERKIGKVPLAGKFNLFNIRAALAVGRIFKVPEKKMLDAIKRFKPLPYRLEYLGNFKGINFYNDALATIPEATIAALDVLGNKVETIFLGGFDRKIDFRKLAAKIKKSNIENLILFPTTGDKIWREILTLKPKNNFKAFMVSNMADAVKLAFSYTKKGKIALMSSASASFGMFKDYKEKGDMFKKYVKKYGKRR